jgi:adenylate kinase
MFKPPQQEGTCDLCGGPLTQRSDDRPEAVGKRLSVYGSQTEPLLGYYRTKGVLVEVDANRSPDEIQQTLIEVLSKES